MTVSAAARLESLQLLESFLARAQAIIAKALGTRGAVRGDALCLRADLETMGMRGRPKAPKSLKLNGKKNGIFVLSNPRRVRRGRKIPPRRRGLEDRALCVEDAAEKVQGAPGPGDARVRRAARQWHAQYGRLDPPCKPDRGRPMPSSGGVRVLGVVTD